MSRKLSLRLCASASQLIFAMLCATGIAAQTTAPVWPKPDLFWYRKTTPAGNIWLKVDVTHGAKEPLFDHQRLAIELTIRTGVEYTPMTLPFADPAMHFVVKYDGANAYIQFGAMAIEFVRDGSQLWRCDLQIKWDWNRVPPTDYECLARRAVDTSLVSAAVAAATNVTRRQSPDGKWEAFVQDNNIAIRGIGTNNAPVRVLSKDGTPDFAYHAGSVLWSPDSKSLAAYRVNSAIWNSESIVATVKQYLVRGEWSVR